MLSSFDEDFRKAIQLSLQELEGSTGEYKLKEIVCSLALFKPLNPFIDLQKDIYYRKQNVYIRSTLLETNPWLSY